MSIGRKATQLPFPFLPGLGRYVRLEATYLPPSLSHRLAQDLAIQFLFAYHRGPEAVQEAVEGAVDRFLAQHPVSFCVEAGAGL